MKGSTALLAAIAFCALCQAAKGDYGVIDKGAWPASWPKELEPLRKQSRTLVGPMIQQQHFEIPFTKREDFESAWPHLLKVKSKGAPIILKRGPKTDFFRVKPAGVLIHSPPAGTDKKANPELPLPGEMDVRTKWMNATYIELVVDGEIVDLNRIPLPADTPIVDERFKAAEQPKGAQEKGEEKPLPAQPTPQPAKTDRERMVGNWFIVNADSLRQGEMWAITEDSILMHAKDGGAIAELYAHRLDAGKNPKQIDITVSRVNGPLIGVMKGIYVLDGDELRLCLGEMGKDRPAAFPEKPMPGEVLVLQRASSGATPPTAKEKPPAKTDHERMVGNWFIVNDNSQRKGEMWVITEDSILMHAMEDGFGGATVRYTYRLDAGKNPKQIDITVSRVKGSTVGVIKGIYFLEGDELRLCLGEMSKGRPTAFPEMPKPGEVLILQRASSGATPAAPKGAGSPAAKGAGGPAENDAVPPGAQDAGSPTVKGAGSPTVKGRGSPTATDAVQPAENDAVPPGAQDGQPVQKILTPEEAIKQRPKEKVTVRFKVTAVQDESGSPAAGFGVGFILLKDGGSFSVRLIPPAMYTIMRLDIEPAKHFTGKVVLVTGLVQSDPTGSSFQISVDDLDRSQFTCLKE